MASINEMKKLNYKRLILGVTAFFALYSFLIYLVLIAESDNESANIKNLPDAIWYSMVTLTTVGYGDFYPVSPEGRAIGYIFLFLSLGFYAVLIGQITTIMNTINENRKLGMYGTKFNNHVVMIGWNDFGKAVTDQLVAAGRNVAIITKEKDNIDIIHEFYKSRNVFVLFSDYNNFDILEKVNVKESSIVFVNLQDDTEKLVYILNMKKNYSELSYVVTLENANLKATFQAAGVTYTISKNEISSKLLASYIFEPDVALYSEEIISFPVTDDHYDIKQYRVLDNNPYVGQFYEKIFFDLKKDYNVILIGIVKNQNGHREMMKNPENSVTVEEGDYLIMIMNKRGMKKLGRYFKIDEGVYQ